MKEKYGPWAVIIGASEGVGAAFAQQLGAAGINLILVARNSELLEALANDVRGESGVEVRTFSLDMAQPGALDRVRAAGDQVEVGLLVMNVGKQYSYGPLVDADPDDLMRTLRVNTLSHVFLSRHFGRGMVERGRGGIVLVGSMAGNAGAATMVMYSAGKAFAQSFAEGLWAEVQPKGVDVLYVVIGAVDTPVRARANLTDPPDLYVASSEEVARQALENLPDGPVFVPPHLTEGFQFFSSAPRKQAAETMRAMMTGFGIEEEKAE